MMEEDQMDCSKEDEGRNSLAALLGYPHTKVRRPKSPDILISYQRRKSCASHRGTDDWEFKILRDGRLIYIHPYKRKARCKETFQLPDACMDELLRLLDPREEELREFVFATRSMGLDGWRDRFMFLGYEFYIWCPHRVPQENLPYYDKRSRLYADVVQNNALLDLFDASACILKNFGFDVTLERIERIGNASGTA